MRRYTRPQPLACYQSSGLSCFAGASSTASWLTDDHDRFVDITGPEIGRVMRAVGWTFDGALSCCHAHDADQAVAVAWVGPIQDAVDRSVHGINISYAVHPDYQGRGRVRPLIALAAFRAFMRSLEERTALCSSLMDADWAVNVQCRAHNERSQRVALGLGLTPNPSRNFTVELCSGPVDYLGFGGRMVDFFHLCSDLARERLVLLDPALRALVQPVDEMEETEALEGVRAEVPAG